MSYLFVQTLVLQLFVGIAFLLLGLWGGKYLWGHDRHHGPPAPKPEGQGSANRKAEDELKKLRLLNRKLEQENHRLREKTGAANLPVEDVSGSRDVEDTLEIVEVPVEPDVPATKPEKPSKQAPKAERDELIRIRGIGKVMAETLEKKGIRTYRQIAEWTKEDIAKLPYGSRVARDKWQTQARRLHKEKYGDKG